MNRRIRALLGTAATCGHGSVSAIGRQRKRPPTRSHPRHVRRRMVAPRRGHHDHKVRRFSRGGSAVAQWRTYTWCQDPITKKPNPPPCDTFVGNFIEDGGIASIALLHPQGQDDRSLSGVLVATSDPAGGFGKWGGSVQYTMLPGNMLLVDTNTGSIMFCGENTDFSQYSPYPCGA